MTVGGMRCSFHRVVREVFAVTVTIKQRPEEWKEGSSANVWERAVQPDREDTKSLILTVLFCLELKSKSHPSQGEEGGERKKERRKIF